jgi:hypothetical protein
MRKAKPNRKTVRAAIRGSVPNGKLKKARIVLSDSSYGAKAVTGFTEYGQDRKTVVKLGAPDSDMAFGITVRGHETRHATKHKPARKKPVTPNEAEAGQRVDDVNVETMALPMMSSESGLEEYRRAHLATALGDLRNIVNAKRRVDAGKLPNSWENRNQRLLASLRVKAMLMHYREGANPKTVKQAIKGSRKLRDILGADTSKALHQIIKLAKVDRSRAKAISMLTMLLESAPVEDYEREGELPETEGGELLMPVTHGEETDGKFRIIDLQPKSAYTAKEREISMKYAPDGVHLNATRFVNAIVQGDSKGLFSRRLRHKAGGTVVIDASGSMGATAQNLKQLAQQVPTATIAYYSGNDRGKGVLAIYADKGKRYAGELPVNTLQGGNAVDLQAVQWLLKHGKPWHLVSDLEFTGGILGSEPIAHALVERAVSRGELEVHMSLDAAYEAFGGKGILGDMRAMTKEELHKRRNEVRSELHHRKERLKARHPDIADKIKGKVGKGRAA